MGAIPAMSQVVGKSPVWRDCWNKEVNTGASSVANSFRTLQGIWSGLDALLGLIPSYSLQTPSSLMINLLIGGLEGPGSAVSLYGSSQSFVKTEPNWFATFFLTSDPSGVVPPSLRVLHLYFPPSALSHSSRMVYYSSPQDSGIGYYFDTASVLF